MAEGKIRFDDIFEEDIFEKARKSAESLLQTLSELDDKLQRIAQANAKTLRELEKEPKTAQNYARIAKTANELANNLRQVSVVQQQLERVKKRLAAEEQNNLRELIKAKNQLREISKDYRALAKSEEAAAKASELLEKVNKGVYESYHELSETLEKLRIRYKDLVAAGQENTDEAKQLQAAIIQLDAKVKQIDYSVGQYQRNVGNYLGDMRTFWASLRNEAMNTQGPLGNILSVLFGMGPAFKAAGGGLAGLANAIKLVGRSLAASGIMVLLTLASGALGKIQEWFSGVFGGGEALRNARNALEVTRQRAALERELVLAEIELNKKETVTSVLNYYSTKIQLKQMELSLTQKLLRENAQLIREEEGKVVPNKKELAELYEKRNNLAEQALSIENELIKIEAERDAKLRAMEEERIKRIEDLVNELNNLERSYTSETERILAERSKIFEDYSKKMAAIAEDVRSEQEVTRVLAAAEAANARINAKVLEELVGIYGKIASELISLDAKLTKNKVASEVAQLTVEAKNAIEQLQKYKNELIALKGAAEELPELLSRIAAETGLLLSTAGDEDVFENLLTQINYYEVELENFYKKRNLAVILKGEIEQLEEDKKVYESLLIMHKDTWSSIEEFNKYKQEAILKNNIDFYKKQLEIYQKYIDTLRSMGLDAQDLEVESQLIAAKLKEAELQLKEFTNSLKNTTDLLKEQVKELGKNLEKLAELFSTIITRIESRQSAMVERSLAATRNRMSVLIAQYQRGSDAASGSIAQLEQRELELLRAQEKIKQQAQRREAALSAFRSYASQLQQGVPPAQALINVVRDLSFITQLVRALPTFYEGTEFVKPAIHPVGGLKDTVLARVHPGERIVPADVNRQLGGVKNEDLPRLLHSKESVTFEYNSLLNTIAAAIKGNNQKSRLIKRI